MAPPISFVQMNVLVRLRSTISCHCSRSSVLGRDVDPPAAHVVDQDVHRSVLLERRSARALRLQRLADVGLDEGGRAPAPFDVGAGRLEGGAVASDQDQVGAGFGERQRHLASQPPAAAGQKAALPVEPEAVEDPHGLLWPRHQAIEREPSAVGIDGGAGHVGRVFRREEHGDARDLVGLGDASERRPHQEPVDHARHAKKLALIGVLTVPGPIPLTRMPCGASETAMPFVSMAMPPLEAA